MKLGILILSPNPSTFLQESLNPHFCCYHLWRIPKSEHESYIQKIGKYIHAVLTIGHIGVDTLILDLLPNLKIVAVNSSGIEAINLSELRARKIRLTNTSGVLTDDVADLGVLLVLSTSRRLCQLDQYVRNKEWEKGIPLAMSNRLKGKVAGIFGFGRIGQAVAFRLQSFGMKIRYYQPSTVTYLGAERESSLLNLAINSDYLILCAPANDRTIRAVNTEVLEALGSQGILINIARGSLVDEVALIKALEQDRLGGAGLDVFENEPVIPDILCVKKNVILTPHIGSFTVETRQAMDQLVIDNLFAYFGGQELITPVL